jgi:hypothetical protein
MVAEQDCCIESPRLLGRTSLTIAFHKKATSNLVGDVSTGVFRPVVPKRIIQEQFFHLHNISLHRGWLASCRLVSSRYVWLGLARDVAAWTKTCLHCQQSKIQHHTKTRPLNIPVTQHCFAHIHIDWWGLYNLVIIVIIFSQSLIEHPNG